MKDSEKEELEKGFIQMGLIALLYLMWCILGFISVITIGYILPIADIKLWLQGTIIVLTQGMGIYSAYGLQKGE